MRYQEHQFVLVYWAAILFWCQPYIESANSLSDSSDSSDSSSEASS